MAEHEFNSGLLMTCICINIGIWLVLGAVSYMDPPQNPEPAGVITVLALFLYVGSLAIAIFQVSWLSVLSRYAKKSTPAASALFCAGFLGFSIMVAFNFMLESGWRNFSHRAFWVMSGTHVSFAAELSTGFFQFFSQRLDTLERLGVEEIRERRKELQQQQEQEKEQR